MKQVKENFVGSTSKFWILQPACEGQLSSRAEHKLFEAGASSNCASIGENRWLHAEQAGRKVSQKNFAEPEKWEVSFALFSLTRATRSEPAITHHSIVVVWLAACGVLTISFVQLDASAAAEKVWQSFWPPQ